MRWESKKKVVSQEITGGENEGKIFKKKGFKELNYIPPTTPKLYSSMALNILAYRPTPLKIVFLKCYYSIFLMIRQT